jgi:hypothetical protein
LEGSRLAILQALLVSVGGFSLGGVNRRKILLWGAIILLACVPIHSMVRLYRDSFRGGATRLSDRAGEFRASSEEFLSSNRTVGDVLLALLERLPPESAAAVFEQTPRPMPYAGLRGVGDVIYVWVPQVIWPQRPDLGDHNELAIEYGVQRRGGTGAVFPAVGDGYRRGGWLGIALLYAFVASCLGLVNGISWTGRYRPELLALLPVVMVSSFETGMVTLVSACYTMLWTFPKYLAFFWFLRVISGLILRKRAHHAAMGQRSRRP